MAMIALASLVVIAQHADAGDDMGLDDEPLLAVTRALAVYLGVA